MTLTKNMRRAKLRNSSRLDLSVQCPREGTHVNMDGEVCLYVSRATPYYWQVELAECFSFKVTRKISTTRMRLLANARIFSFSSFLIPVTREKA